MTKSLYILLTPFIGLIMLVSIRTATAYQIPENPYQQKTLYSVSKISDWGLDTQQIDNSIENNDSKILEDTKIASSQRATPLSVVSRGESTQSSAAASSQKTSSNTASVSKSNTATISQSSSTSIQPSSSNDVDSIIATAKKYLGVHYVYGGSSPSGFDCSGYVKYVFSKNGITLPRTASQQYSIGTKVSTPKAGDLVFFSTSRNGHIDHVGISLGGGRFINSASSRGVIISSLDSYWQPRYVGAKRVL